MSLQDELDDVSSSGMSVHDVDTAGMSVHGDGISVDMEGDNHRDDAEVYFEFIDAHEEEEERRRCSTIAERLSRRDELFIVMGKPKSVLVRSSPWGGAGIGG